MKSTVKQNHKPKKFDYKNGLVVYKNHKSEILIAVCDSLGTPFNEDHFCGTIVFTESSNWEIGEHSEYWTKNLWKEFHGEVTLSH